MFLVAFQTRTFFAWRLLIPLAHLPYQLKTHTNNYASRGIPTRQHTVTNIRRCIKMSVKPTWFCCIELIWLFKQCVVKVFQIFNLESMSKNWQKPKAKSKKQKAKTKLQLYHLFTDFSSKQNGRKESWKKSARQMPNRWKAEREKELSSQSTGLRIAAG